MTKEQFEKFKAAMAEHKHKLETDPEYKKRSEEIGKKFEAVGWPFTKYNG